MRVLRAAHSLSLNVPRDIAVVGFDNLPICSETFPPLSSIAYPIRKLAESALDILNEIKAGRNVGRRRILLEPQLVIRQSSVIKKG
jgi:LacI family transcriptional regulator